jgi:hypothetical protein
LRVCGHVAAGVGEEERPLPDLRIRASLDADIVGGIQLIGSGCGRRLRLTDGRVEEEACAKKKRLGDKVVVGRDNRVHRCRLEAGSASVCDKWFATMEVILFRLFLELFCSERLEITRAQ